MRKKHKLIAGIAGAAAVLTACSGQAPQAPDVTKVKLADTTAKGTKALDKVTWLLDKEPENLDLDALGGNNPDTIMANVCERLFQVQPDLTVKPQLAEKVDWPDDTTMVVTLRKGVKFHDGTELTADDALWSLERHAKPGADESDEFEGVSSMKKTGDLELTIKLKEPNALFELSMAGDGGILFSKKIVEAAGDDYGTPGHEDGCTGPYAIKEWRSGTDITLERFDQYWNPAVKPLTKTVVFRWAEENALVNTLTTGAADGSYLASASAATPLSNASGIGLYFGRTTAAWSLIPTGRGAMKKTELRQALSLALDRAGIAKSGFGGFAQPARTPVGSGAFAYEQAKLQGSYDKLAGAPASPSQADLDKAKQLVEQAGAPAEPIVIAGDGSQQRTVIANATRDAAQKIGLKAEIKTVPPAEFSSYFTDEKARAEVDLVPEDWYISKNDPIGFYDNALTGNENNWVGYSDKEFDEAVKTALRTPDDAERAGLVVEAQEKFAADAVWLPIVSLPATLAMSDKITGAPASMSYLYYPWAADLGGKG